MSEADTEEQKGRYSPQHPLPDAIQKMERDETVCRYCGVSYLIHSEIKALEKKLKEVEKEMERYKGCEEREQALKVEIKKLLDQRGEFEMNITVKDAAISNLTNKLKIEEQTSLKLRNEKDEATQKLTHVEQSIKALKDRNNRLERALPNLKSAIHDQRTALDAIHSYLQQRDSQMKEEVNIILSHVRTTCQLEVKAKSELKDQMLVLQSKMSRATSDTESMKQQLHRQEQRIQQLDKLFTENEQLQQKCAQLETSQAGLKKELEESIERCRSLQMETHQFKEQFKTKNSEIEEMSNIQRRKEMAMEMTTQKLKTDLKQRETDLLSAKRELKDLQNKFEQHQQMEADLTRKTSKTLYETKELKESFYKAKEEIENLKEEREVMITSHQNRIEQLRESFKEKLMEEDNWQEKLDAAILKEKERHAKELQALETRLKENFVMELEIEKGKYRELMKKYQSGSQENEEKLRAQLQSIESRYKAEIEDLNQLLAENRRKSHEMEKELRQEIASLKAIIKDLEARLGRLDVGNDELVVKLKSQLRETHQELEDTRIALDKQTKATDDFQEQVRHLQDTVQKECEERFELTEALSVAKEELLVLKKPAGGYSMSTISTRRQLTSLSLKSEEESPSQSAQQSRRSVAEPQPPLSNRPNSSTKPRIYNEGMKREYTLTNSNNMVFMGEESNGVKAVGGNAVNTNRPTKHNSITKNRNKIAKLLGRYIQNNP